MLLTLLSTDSQYSHLSAELFFAQFPQKHYNYWQIAPREVGLEDYLDRIDAQDQMREDK